MVNGLSIKQLQSLDKKQIIDIATTGKRFMVDETIPRRKKVFIALCVIGAFGYLLSPIDFVPDALPFVGTLDDAAPFVGITWSGVLMWVRQRALKASHNHLLNLMAKPQLVEDKHKTRAPGDESGSHPEDILPVDGVILPKESPAKKSRKAVAKSNESSVSEESFGARVEEDGTVISL
ncbi:MAG: YkvA family protein [Candidatus Saccharimonadales bacterium]